MSDPTLAYGSAIHIVVRALFGVNAYVISDNVLPKGAFFKWKFDAATHVYTDCNPGKGCGVLMRPRLEVIAQKAGVSLATVSRVLNNLPNVSDRTRERVLAALRELSPPRRQTLIIGLILPDTANQFFTELAFELDRECERRGASLMIASSDGRADRELNLLDRFISLGIDGLLFISSGTGQSEALLRTVAGAEMPPIIAFDRGLGSFDRVTVDSRKGTEQAVDHLVAHGHSRIGYLKGQANTETAIERFESFQIAMAKNHLEITDDWVFEGDYRPDSGRQCAEALFALERAQRPTAMLAGNDLMAVALMQRLQEAGWKLPQDLSIIGFDDIPVASWVYPRLTTIAQPITRLVREAMNLLTQRIAEFAPGNKVSAPRVVTIEPELTPRSSVDSPNSDRQRCLIQVTE
jgi:DNA-binding LacI/PurR family transcriptional regulator